MKMGDLSAGSLLKLGLVCGISFWLFVFLLLGLIALAGGDSVKMNDQQLVGLPGLLAALLMGLVFGAANGIVIMIGGLLARIISPLRRIELNTSSHIKASA